MRTRSALLCLALAVSLCAPFGATGSEMQVHFIDVGQGDAVLVDLGTTEILIDGGPGSACISYIKPFVTEPLELLVATHPDADHIGGLDDVLQALTVSEIWLNGDTHTTQTYA